ncbi:hypothetical protein HID58_005485 [Brassica napus]|uniref:Uncharacterized protein n=1 Tax=Brassica napus TaxID=3708 RepID=A0ABQ8E8N9_BRANA|nr:hypothetical protein HID58_005485 [Brassica napus]
MQPPSPQESDIHRKTTSSSAGVREKARPNSTMEAKTVADLEPWIYASRNINHLRSIQEINMDSQIESRLGKEILRMKASEIGAVKATVFRKRKMVMAVWKESPISRIKHANRKWACKKLWLKFHLSPSSVSDLRGRTEQKERDNIIPYPINL